MIRRIMVFMCVAIVGSTIVHATEEVADPLGETIENKLGEVVAEPTEKASRKAATEQLIAALPEDTTPRFEIREVQLTGNALLDRQTLLGDLPVVYDSRVNGAARAAGDYLYDFRDLRKLVADTSTVRSISARTMRGLTEYILSVYIKHGYAGIYVYVPSEAFGDDAELARGILPVRIIEATVSQVGVSYHNVRGEPAEKGYLRSAALLNWSPVKEGEVARRKDMDDLLNLLNLNPDRYVSAVVTRGSEPNTLAVEYNVYEASPWHWFAQLDNAGTKDRQWTPRFGLINTNLLGFDDTFTLIYQTPLDKRMGDEYSLYGSYDFPVLGPRLRLNVFGGLNEFATTGTGDVSFLGRGHFYGGTLRFNVLQKDGWFLDLTGTVNHLTSKITPSIFPKELGSDVGIDQWGIGVEAYRRDDMTDTHIALQRFASFNASSDREIGLARAGAKGDFSLYTAAFNHSRFLDEDKIQTFSGSIRYTVPDERLHPSQMTAFGGMYSVRGYDEFEVVADGGLLASLQYEYDLVKRNQAKQRQQEPAAGESDQKPFVRKLAPLVFTDFGLAHNRDARAYEKTQEELWSLGIGAKLELGDNFTGVVYYGFPMLETESTRRGKGRVNVGFLWRY